MMFFQLLQVAHKEQEDSIKKLVSGFRCDMSVAVKLQSLLLCFFASYMKTIDSSETSDSSET